MLLENVIETNKAIDLKDWDPELTKDIQLRLASLGLYPRATIDGKMGAKTKDAFKAFKEITFQSAPTLIGAGSAELLLDLVEKTEESVEYGVKIIKEFEALRLTVYKDPRTGDKPYTVGWGSTRKEDGSPWKLGETITEVRAQKLLTLEIESVILPEMFKIPAWKDLNSNQQGALISFAYNLGANFYEGKGFDTITRVLKEKKFFEVPKVLELYINKGTNVEDGLRRRRKSEGALWLGLEEKKNLTAVSVGGLADRIYKCCKNKGYKLQTRPGEVNIIGVEGINVNGTKNPDSTDGWNDVICLLTFKADKPILLGIYQGTTEPGIWYTKNPLSYSGVARLQVGQHPDIWRVGIHRGYEAMQQVGKAVLVRDKNKNFMRDDAVTVETSRGINLHRTLTDNWQVLGNVGKFSAGCVVIKSYNGFLEFMKYIKGSAQYKESPSNRFTFTLLWRDWL